MKKTKSFWRINNTLLKLVSLVLAVVAWVGVAITDSTSINRTIRDIPINVTSQEGALTQLGLSIIEMDIDKVTAYVKGDRLTVGGLEPDQIGSTLQLSSGLSEPNTYELKIVSAANSSGTNRMDYEIVRFEPEYVKVKLDRLATRIMMVETEIIGDASIAEGFIREEKESLTPKTITVSGPQVELDRIQNCVVRYESTAPLSSTLTEELDVILLDAEGKEMDLEERHLRLDNESVQLVISVLKEITLPLEVEFLNTPRSFPKEELAYTLSDESIQVAGPPDLADKYKELMLGFIDISQVNLSNYTFSFQVDLPSTFNNLKNIQDVTVTFPVEKWEEEIFSVEDIQVLNPPTKHDVTLVTTQIPGVRIVGDRAIIQELTAEDIVVELNLAEGKNLDIGQYQLPVKISAPTKGLVWATGSYSVIVQVTETQ